MKDENYIQASLIVVSPGEAIYSAGGHIALRMICPMQQVDYTYEFVAKIGGDESLIHKYLNGTLEGNYIRLFSDTFYTKVNEEDREASEYILNLTPMQKVMLWSLLDDAVDEENNRYPFIPMTNNCCSMLLPLIARATNYDIFSDMDTVDSDKTTGRDYLEDIFCAHPWTGLIWNILFGTEFDKRADTINLLYPKIINKSLSMLVNPENGKNLLINNSFHQKSLFETNHHFLQPKYIFIFIFIMSCCLTILNMKNRFKIVALIFDGMLLLITTFLGCILWYMFLVSIINCNPNYNMMLAIFNPAPVLLLLIRNKQAWVIYSLLIAVVATLCLFAINYIPQIQLYGLWLLIATILVRSLTFCGTESTSKIFVTL